MFDRRMYLSTDTEYLEVLQDLKCLEEIEIGSRIYPEKSLGIPYLHKSKCFNIDYLLLKMDLTKVTSHPGHVPFSRDFCLCCFSYLINFDCDLLSLRRSRLIAKAVWGGEYKLCQDIGSLFCRNAV